MPIVMLNKNTSCQRSGKEPPDHVERINAAEKRPVNRMAGNHNLRTKEAEKGLYREKRPSNRYDVRD